MRSKRSATCLCHRAEIQVTDLIAMQKYGEKMPETLATFNHHYLVRGASPRLSRAKGQTAS